MNSLVEGLNNATLRWELRKLKPETANRALRKAFKLLLCLELEGLNHIGQPAAALPVWTVWLISSRQKTLLFLTNLSDHLKETPTTSRSIESDRRKLFFMVEGEKETRSWTRDGKMVQRSERETDMQIKHVITALHICLRATDTKMAMIHAADMPKDTAPENVSQNNKKYRMSCSHLPMTEDTIAKKTLTVEMNKTDHNHYTRTDKMFTFSITDDDVTTTKSSNKTKHSSIVKELITLPENVKLVFIARRLDISVMSAAPRGQVR